MAGWVFADMLLVLVIVGLGMAKPTAPEPTPEPALPHVEPPKPEKRIIGMETTHHDVHLHFSGSQLLQRQTAVTKRICGGTRLGTKAYKDRRAGLVLIFGGSSEPSIGQAVAERIGDQLRCANRLLFRDDTVVRYFWDGGLSQNAARVEIYLFAVGTKTT